MSPNAGHEGSQQTPAMASSESAPIPVSCEAQDGLIPAASEKSPTLNADAAGPEVSDHLEKSYPELLPPGFRSQTAHSLRRAWSPCDEQQQQNRDRLPAVERGEPVPLWKRPIVWVLAGCVAIIVVLIGVLGGMASGRIPIAAAAGSAVHSTTVTYTTENPPTCPTAHHANFVLSIAPYNNAQMERTFHIQCNTSYLSGGTLTVKAEAPGAGDSLAACLTACAQNAECVGAVRVRPEAASRNGGESGCFLKEALELAVTGFGVEGIESGVWLQ